MRIAAAVPSSQESPTDEHGEGAGDENECSSASADRGVEVDGDAVVAEPGPGRAAPVADVELGQLLEAHHDADDHRHQVDQEFEEQGGQQQQVRQPAAADRPVRRGPRAAPAASRARRTARRARRGGGGGGHRARPHVPASAAGPWSSAALTDSVVTALAGGGVGEQVLHRGADQRLELDSVGDLRQRPPRSWRGSAQDLQSRVGERRVALGRLDRRDRAVRAC